MKTQHSYDIFGYFTFEDWERKDPARHLIDVSNKKKAIQVAKRSLEDYLITTVEDYLITTVNDQVAKRSLEDNLITTVNDTIIFTKNKLFTQYLKEGIHSFKKKELPLLMGIDPKLDEYIADQLKE